MNDRTTRVVLVALMASSLVYLIWRDSRGPTYTPRPDPNRDLRERHERAHLERGLKRLSQRPSGEDA